MSNEQKSLPVVAWVELNNDHVDFQYGPDAPPFAEDWTALTQHAEAQHAIDCMDAEIARLTAERDAALAATEAFRVSLAYSETERDAALADARRYRNLRRGQKWSVIDGGGDILRADALDATIDAALAATGEPT